MKPLSFKEFLNALSETASLDILTKNIPAPDFAHAKLMKLFQTYSIIGYELGKTLSDNGTVSRGVCSVDADGNLLDINERTKIFKNEPLSKEHFINFKILPLDKYRYSI